MKFIKTEIPEVVIIEPKVWRDDRGYFFECFKLDQFQKEIGNITFVQENESKSVYGALRGLHYQLPPFAQSKIVKVVEGKVLDIAVDLRKNSPFFGKYVSVELSEENKKQLFIPQGFAHGFVTLSEYAIFQYKADNYYSRESEAGIIYNDEKLNIDWQIDADNIKISDKDNLLPSFNDVVKFK
jgi:dTDP-4-dehydrorhamnose 3,5-epimerase